MGKEKIKPDINLIVEEIKPIVEQIKPIIKPVIGIVEKIVPIINEDQPVHKHLVNWLKDGFKAISILSIITFIFFAGKIYIQLQVNSDKIKELEKDKLSISLFSKNEEKNESAHMAILLGISDLKNDLLNLSNRMDKYNIETVNKREETNKKLNDLEKDIAIINANQIKFKSMNQ